MKPILRQWTLGLGLLLGLSLSLDLNAQKPDPKTKKDNRPTEKMVYLEKDFLEAKQEVILGNYDEAIAKFLELLPKDNDNPVLHFELASLYVRIEQYDRATQRAARAAELEPGNVHCVELYAELLERQNDYLKAATLYEQLVKRYPERNQYYGRWAFYLDKAGKTAQAIKVYEQLEQRVGPQAEIAERKYRLLMQSGKDKKALEVLEKLAQANPQAPDSWLRLANHFQNLKQPDKATSYYRKVLDLQPSNTEANVAMAEVFRREKDTLRYFQALQVVFAEPEEGIEPKYKVMQPILQQYPGLSKPEYKAAVLELAATLARVHPRSYQAGLAYGQLLVGEERYMDAIAPLEQALTADRSRLPIWYYLLEAYHHSKRKDMLLKRGEEMTELFPSQGIGYYYYGLGLLHKGDFTKMVKVLEPAQLMAGDNENLEVQLGILLGHAYAQQGQYAKSDALFEKQLAKQPDNPEIFNLYSLSLVLRHDKLAQASDYAQQAVNADPNKAEYIHSLARVYYKQNKYREAKELWQRALRQTQNSAESALYLEGIGDAAFHLGERQDAKDFWRKALDAGSSSSILRRKIETGQIYE